jgi:hypothetical protein
MTMMMTTEKRGARRVTMMVMMMMTGLARRVMMMTGPHLLLHLSHHRLFHPSQQTNVSCFYPRHV